MSSNRLLCYIILGSYIVSAILAGYYHNFTLAAISVILFLIALFISFLVEKGHKPHGNR